MGGGLGLIRGACVCWILAGVRRVWLIILIIFSFCFRVFFAVSVGTVRSCNSQADFGVTVAGEFSNGYNDCALFLNGVTDPHNGVDCSFWEDSTQWNQTIKDGLKNYAMASMDALQNWFFWTWKVRFFFSSFPTQRFISSLY